MSEEFQENHLPQPPYQVPPEAARPQGMPQPSYQVPPEAARPQGMPQPPYQVPPEAVRPQGMPQPPYQVPPTAVRPQGMPQPPYMVPPVPQTMTPSSNLQPKQKRDGNTYGLVSMILGILSVFLFATCVNYVLAIIAIVFGIIQLVKYQKKGFAVAGLVTSGISIVLSIVMWVMIIVMAGNNGLYDDNYYDDYYNDYYDGYYDDLYEYFNDNEIEEL